MDNILSKFIHTGEDSINKSSLDAEEDLKS